MNDHNPYLPPTTAVADDRVERPPPKPWAVSITQILAVAAALMLAVGITRYFYGIWEWSKVGVTMIWMPTNTGFRIAFLVVLFVMLYQLPRRSQLGRWCGVALFLFLLGALIWLVVTSYLSLEDRSQVPSLFLSFLICFVPAVWLLYAFAFSRKARAYFRSSARN